MQDLYQWIEVLCCQSRQNQEFCNEFIERLERYPDIAVEMEYYRQHGEFQAELTVAGCTVIDIMVWQIDHFKSHMDRGEQDMQSNPACMVLMAFDTLLRMKEQPEPYIQAMRSETGTDYVGKY